MGHFSQLDAGLVDEPEPLWVQQQDETKLSDEARDLIADMAASLHAQTLLLREFVELIMTEDYQEARRQLGHRLANDLPELVDSTRGLMARTREVLGSGRQTMELSSMRAREKKSGPPVQNPRL